MNNNLERLIKQTTPFNNEYVKGELGILYTSSMLNNQSVHFFKPFNITPQQYNILRILRGQYPKVININAIKERMLDKMSDASRIVEKLRLKGLAERHICAHDRRSCQVFITQKGMDLLTEIDKLDDQMETFSAQLTAEEQRTLNLLLDKLRG